MSGGDLTRRARSVDENFASSPSASSNADAGDGTANRRDSRPYSQDLLGSKEKEEEE